MKGATKARSANVVSLDVYKNGETIEVLTELLRRAKSGEITGLVFIVRAGPLRHRTGFTGEYWRDPLQALGTVARLQHRLNHIINDRDEEDDEAHTMPL